MHTLHHQLNSNVTSYMLLLTNQAYIHVYKDRMVCYDSISYCAVQ